MNREVLEKDEALAIKKFRAHGAQERCHSRERKIGGRDGGQRGERGKDCVGGGGEFGDFRGRKRMSPSFRVVGIGRGVPEGRASDSFGEG